MVSNENDGILAKELHTIVCNVNYGHSVFSAQCLISVTIFIINLSIRGYYYAILCNFYYLSFQM